MNTDYYYDYYYPGRRSVERGRSDLRPRRRRTGAVPRAGRSPLRGHPPRRGRRSLAQAVPQPLRHLREGLLEAAVPAASAGHVRAERRRRRLRAGLLRHEQLAQVRRGLSYYVISYHSISYNIIL